MTDFVVLIMKPLSLFFYLCHCLKLVMMIKILNSFHSNLVCLLSLIYCPKQLHTSESNYILLYLMERSEKEALLSGTEYCLIGYFNLIQMDLYSLSHNSKISII